ncbi:MAG: isoprenylcysteine carboxylmethyltransferase family protein, partial [Planctomycetota bacterium]
MNPKHIVAGYFVIQSFATLAWWVLLFAYPPSTKWFQPIDWPTATLHSFWLADAIVIVGGSFVAAVSVLRDYRHRHLIVWSVAVSTVYPTLFCIATSQLSGEAWVAASLMSALSGMSLAMATIHGMKDQTSATTRVAEMNGLKSVGWTLLQTIFFWGIFLWVFPKGLMEIQAHLSLAFFHHRNQETGSFLLFAFASMIGLMSGLTMATRGSGTPLPTATASQLVVVGPY